MTTRPLTLQITLTARRLWIAAIVALLAAPVGAVAFQRSQTFNDVTITGVLTTTASASGDAALQTGDIVFSTTGACRTGFAEYTALRGRYLVGLPSGGTNAGTTGTALTDLENRAVGQHNHGVTDPGHNHTQNAHSHGVTDPGHSHGVTDPGHVHTNSVTTWTGGITAAGGTEAGNFATANSTTSATTGVTVNSNTTGISTNNATATNNSNTTGVTVNNSGSVAGTNAPYLQLIACRKS
jgi:hypothetical protein